MVTKLHTLPALMCLLLFFSACQKEFSFPDEIIPVVDSGTAAFTYTGTPGNCTNPAITGIFTAGKALDSSNKIIIQVNVTDTGTYGITSNIANGIKFSAAGTFVLKGLQTISLAATGTPAAGGTFNFTPGAATCTFPITCTGLLPVSSGDCKECSYVPLCAGSKYIYNDTTYGVGTVKIADYLSSVDTTIDGKIYKKITVTNNSTAYYNCTNGESKVVGYQLVSLNGNTLQKVQLTMIKANEAVGATWTENITNPIGQVVIQKFTIEAKGVSKTLNGVKFNDIIVVGLESGIDLPSYGYVQASFTRYYYAKGIGLVESVTEESTMGQIVHHSVIKSYFIP